MKLKFEYKGVTYPFSIFGDESEECFVMIPEPTGDYFLATIDDSGRYVLKEMIAEKDVKVIIES